MSRIAFDSHYEVVRRTIRSRKEAAATQEQAETNDKRSVKRIGSNQQSSFSVGVFDTRIASLLSYVNLEGSNDRAPQTSDCLRIRSFRSPA